MRSISRVGTKNEAGEDDIKSRKLHEDINYGTGRGRIIELTRDSEQ
mgnify:CR=1 FL=1